MDVRLSVAVGKAFKELVHDLRYGDTLQTELLICIHVSYLLYQCGPPWDFVFIYYWLRYDSLELQMNPAYMFWIVAAEIPNKNPSQGSLQAPHLNLCPRFKSGFFLLNTYYYCFMRVSQNGENKSVVCFSFKGLGF